MSVCVNVPVETLFTTSTSFREDIQLQTRTVIYEGAPLVTTEYRCAGCKGSGGPDYCPLTPMPATRSDMPCSYWYTDVRTDYPTFEGSTELQIFTTTTTVPVTTVYPTETRSSTICSDGPPVSSTSPRPQPPSDSVTSSSTIPRPDQPSQSNPASPSSSARSGPGSQVVQPGTTPSSGAPRTTAPQSAFTSVSTSVSLRAVQVTVTANGSTLVRTSTSSYAVNATIIGGSGSAGITNANASGGGSTTPVGAIAGGVAGGIIALLVIGGLLWWRKRKARREHAGGTGGNYWAEDDVAGAGSGPVMTNTYRASGVATGAALLEDKDDEANHVEPYVPSVGYGATSPPPQSMYSVSQASAPYGAAGVGAVAAAAGGYGVVNSAASARNEKAQLMASYAANDAHSQAPGAAGGSTSAAAYDTYADSTATGSSQPQHSAGAFPPVEQHQGPAPIAVAASYPAAQQQQQPTSPVDSQFGQRTSIHQSADDAMTGFVIPGSVPQGQNASHASKIGRNSSAAEPTPGQGAFAGHAAGPSGTRGDDAASFVEMPPLYSPTA